MFPPTITDPKFHDYQGKPDGATGQRKTSTVMEQTNHVETESGSCLTPFVSSVGHPLFTYRLDRDFSVVPFPGVRKAPEHAKVNLQHVQPRPFPSHMNTELQMKEAAILDVEAVVENIRQARLISPNAKAAVSGQFKHKFADNRVIKMGRLAYRGAHFVSQNLLRASVENLSGEPDPSLSDIPFGGSLIDSLAWKYPKYRKMICAVRLAATLVPDNVRNGLESPERRILIRMGASIAKSLCFTAE